MKEVKRSEVNAPRQRISGFVSILMVNWNDLRFLGGSLESIRKQVTVPHEVIVFDNASQDDSISFIESGYPEVNIIRNSENIGFIRGTNQAAKHARGEFYLMLNPDTILRTDIAPAVRLLEADRGIGAVGASMYDGEGKPKASCGNYPSLPRLLVTSSLFWRPYRGRCGPAEFGARRVDWTCGAWLLTRASAWERIGGLDEQLFFYSDDLHYCRSLRGIGLATAHMPSLAYTHFVGFSLTRQPYLYAGFRWFHAKFSGRMRRRFADIVMKAGLYIRVISYGALALFLRNSRYNDRRKSARRVLDVWDQTATPGGRFQ